MALPNTPHAQLIPDRRQRTDAERIQDLQNARREFIEALSVYRHAKARLEAVIAETGDK